MIKMSIIFLSMLSLVLMLACTRKGEQTKKDLSGREINVVTTIGMIADVVENVGGERVQVKGLMGPGIDPHLYKAGEGDVSRMSNADIIFYNGLHLEGKMTEVFEQMQKQIKTVAVSDSIDRFLLISPTEFEGAPNPHLWFDVTLWMDVVVKIRDALSEIDPTSLNVYWDNAQNYLQKLAELQKYVKSQVEKLPIENRILITAHDAFNYFGRAYDFDVRGLQGISTAAEAGTADVQALAEFIKENKIPAIFVETSVPPRYIEALQAAVKARGYDVKIGGHLFSDAMGDSGTEEGTYIGMVRKNIDTIVNSLLK